MRSHDRRTAFRLTLAKIGPIKKGIVMPYEKGNGKTVVIALGGNALGNTPQEQLHRNLTLDEAVELYQNSDHPEKRLGVTKDDFATVDFVRMVDGEQTFFGDYQKLESFKNDPTIFEAVEQLHQELEDMSQDQGMTM
mgnify:CR=1 FL=1